MRRVERSARSAATWGLLALLVLATVLPAVSATRSVLTALGVRRAGEEELLRAGSFGVHGEDALRNVEGMTALFTGPAAVVGLLLFFGVLTWRTWAREAVLAVLGLVGGLVCLLSLAGVAGGARNGVEGVVAGLVLLGGAALAVSPPVCADFDRHRIAGEVRERRRREQERREREAAQQERDLRSRHLRDQALRDRTARERELPGQRLPDQPRTDPAAGG